MKVAKFIRTLGYMIYTILCIPAIVAALTIIPICGLIIALCRGQDVKKLWKSYISKISETIKHDINFINTGNW